MPEIIKVTNPEAQELIRKIQTGEIILPLKERLIRYKLPIFIAVMVLFTILAIIFGISLGNQKPSVYIPDNDVSFTPTPSLKKTQTEIIREEIIDANLYLPDPELPTFDLRIDLREAYID